MSHWQLRTSPETEFSRESAGLETRPPGRWETRSRLLRTLLLFGYFVIHLASGFTHLPTYFKPVRVVAEVGAEDEECGGPGVGGGTVAGEHGNG